MQVNRPIRRGKLRRPVTRWYGAQGAYALCDGCKFLTYHNDLREQMEYRGGTSPVGTGWLVCRNCYDTPNAQFAPPLLKPDPVPTRNPRPDDGEDKRGLVTEGEEQPIITEGEDPNDGPIGVS